MALHASGYRVNKSRPGHHEYAIRSLGLILGPQWQSTVSVFDQARITRGRLDYETIGTATQSELRSLRAEIEKVLPEIRRLLETLGFRWK